MIDVLYVVGTESKYDNLELRLSLRSIEQNGQNIGRVYLIGYKPNWVQNVIHIDEPDDLTRENNTFKKVLVACKNGISDEFLLMNDDFFMMKEFDAENYPYYVSSERLVWIENPSRYQEVLNKSIGFLSGKGINRVKDYRMHCPIRYNREKFLSLEEVFNKYKKSNVGVSHRLIYGNLFVDKYEVVSDNKIFGKDLPDFEYKQKCISTANNGEQILSQLGKIFNKSSRYEKNS